MKKQFRSLLNGFIVSFFEGVMIVAPLIITIWLVRFLVGWINSLVLSPLLKLLMIMKEDVQHVIMVKSIIFFAVILGLAVIGWGAKVIFLRRLFANVEKLFLNVPFLGRVYKALRQVVRAISGQNKSVFKSVVLVEYPRKGIFSIGFMTGLPGSEVNSCIGSESYSVFVPSTPNPATGMFMVVPKQDVKFLNMSVEDGMKLVISGGFVSPAEPGK